MVAHPNRVGVRKTKAQLAADSTMVFDDDVSLAAHVLSRGLDVWPDARFKKPSSMLIDHELQPICLFG